MSRANRMLALRDLAIHPGGSGDGPVLFTIDEVVLRPGERIALLAPNGAGKSSLINRLVGHYRQARDDTRQIAFSPQAELGYYDQDLAELDGHAGMADWVAEVSGAASSTVKGALIHAGFPFRVHGTALGDLSGGERSRVLFAALALRRPNLLVLDEPTNHIDIEGREDLEEQLLGSGATLLLTSHDRRFVDTVAERFLVIEDGRLREEHDPDAFYRRLVAAPLATPGDHPAGAGAAAGTGRAADTTGGEVSTDAALARLVDLEELLAADLARKPRFQKPDRQASWRAEIDALQARLGLDG